MKNIKKAVALLLTLIMMLSASAFAFAEDTDPSEPEIKIEQPAEKKSEKKEEPQVEEPKAEIKIEEPVIELHTPAAQTPAETEPAPETNEEETAPVVEEIVMNETEPSEQTNSAEATNEQEVEPTQETEQEEIEELEIIEEEMEEMLIAARPATDADGQVVITANTNTPQFGDKVKLSSKLIGFSDDLIVLYQWQVDKNDGNGWQNIKGATQKSYKFVYTEDIVGYSWRLMVSIEEYDPH